MNTQNLANGFVLNPEWNKGTQSQALHTGIGVSDERVKELNAMTKEAHGKSETFGDMMAIMYEKCEDLNEFAYVCFNMGSVAEKMSNPLAGIFGSR